MNRRCRTEEELRRQFYGAPDIPLAEWREWEFLKENLHVRDAINEGETWEHQRKLLMEGVTIWKKALEIYSSHPDNPDDEPDPDAPRVTTRHPGRDRDEIAVSPEELRRAEVVGVALARIASGWNDVARLRAFLPGGRLTEDHARAFLASRAAEVLPFGTFRTFEIPLVGHEAEIERFDRVAGNRYAVALRLTPPGKTIERISQPVPAPPSSRADRAPRGGDEITEPRSVFEMFPDSAVGELWQVATRLSERLPWDEQEAARFVLTGAPPAVAALRWRAELHKAPRYTYGRIILEVEPWVGDDTVQTAYKILQENLRGGNKPRKKGRRTNNRPIQEKALDAFQFVEQRLGPADPPRATRELWERWNACQHDEARQFSSPTRFTESYRRTRRLLLHPDLRLSPTAREGDLSDVDRHADATG